jgi:phospholipid/cholesterol/gamma-HCH transport system substrate-binding protein
MRLTTRQIVNVLLVSVVGWVAVAWCVVGLAEVDLFGHPTKVSLEAPAAAGALPGAEVTYLGVPVGTVTSSDLAPGGVRVELELDPAGPMARDLRADIRQKSALGEPYVDLSPAAATSPVGDPDGTTIPIDRVSVPRSLDTLLGAADRLLSEVDPHDLGRLLEGASGIVGRESDLQALLADGAAVSELLAARRSELGTLTASAAALASTLDEHRDALDRGIVGFDRLGGVLASRTGELAAILANGADLGESGAGLLADVRPDLHELLRGLDVTLGNLAERPGRVRETIALAPLMISRFGYTFEGGNFWLSAGGGTVFFPGYQPRYGVPVYGSGLRIDRIIAPTLAQRITVDLGGSPVAGIIQLLGPEDSAAAASDPVELLAIQQREAARAGMTVSPVAPPAGG